MMDYRRPVVLAQTRIGGYKYGLSDLVNVTDTLAKEAT